MLTEQVKFWLLFVTALSTAFLLYVYISKPVNRWLFGAVVMVAGGLVVFAALRLN